MDRVWPLVTFVWAALLTLLAATLVLRGIVGLTCASCSRARPSRRGRQSRMSDGADKGFRLPAEAEP